MATYTDLVFVSNDDLQSVAAEVALALGVTLEWRESWYRGGEYLLSIGEFGDERTSVQRNVEIDELAEPDYPDALTLVQMEGTRRPEEIEHRLSQTSMILIRRSTRDQPDRGSEQDSETRR
ncbi:hypothetical protein [Planotetraspora kaengkrachanensis]|uniref:Uncharacterized protein n=1 Tax=Planotetraspora kaengkrachanensis TaxID=575193 RepID=A0A8J3Q0I0_9ACTN|nr:hypothetical protein [Planotetraspora kaengkrachanensis]GIG84497.1 hypothetical protein Pka01_76240 [Planotetraspora kaengkrachanensis]